MCKHVFLVRIIVCTRFYYVCITFVGSEIRVFIVQRGSQGNANLGFSCVRFFITLTALTVIFFFFEVFLILHEGDEV